MKQSIILTIILVLFSVGEMVQAQNNSVTIGGSDIDNEAVLWLVPSGNDGKQGLILPVTERDGFSPLEQGMIIYDPSDLKVYFWDGSVWQSLGSSGAIADNWGTQTVQTDLILTGDGTTDAPLTIASQDAEIGQILKWDGSTWIPSDDLTSVTGTVFTAGEGIAINVDNVISNTGDSDADPINELQNLSFDPATNELSLTDGNSVTIPTGGTDADADPTNELQTLSFDPVTNELTLSDGNTITIPTGGTDADADPTNEIQDLILTGTDLEITGGSTIDLSAIIPPGGTDDQNLILTDDVLTIEGGTGAIDLNNYLDDADADATNEFQNLSFDPATNELSLSDGNSITIPTGGTDADADPTNEIQTLTFDPATNELSLTDGGVVTIPTGGTDADADPTNELQTLTFDPTTNELTLSNGNTIIIPTGGTDADADPTNEIQDLVLIDDILGIEGGAGMVDLNEYVDDADADATNEIQTLTFDALTNELSLTDGGVVTIPTGGTDGDADPTNELQILTLNGTELEITAGNTVDLAAIIPPGGTDDQNLILTGDVLTIEGGAGTVDLNEYVDDADADATNEIQTLTFDALTNELSLTDGGVVTIPTGGTDADADPSNELQDLILTGDVLTIEGGAGTVDLNEYVDDADADATNEIQTLTFDALSNELSLTNGGVVTIPTGGTDADADPTNELQNLTYDADANAITISDGNTINLVSQSGAFVSENGVVKQTVLNNDDFVFGSEQLDNDPTNPESQNRMFYDKSKGAFRAGSTLTAPTVWDDESVGFYSAAFGSENRAQGDNSLAYGVGNIALGFSSLAGGSYSVASGTSSTTMGVLTTAIGESSVALGNESIAEGDYSMSMGNQTTASGESALAMGDNTNAIGTNSVAMGTQTTASGLASLAIGNFTEASGLHAVSMGGGTTASGDLSFAMGSGTAASGNYSVAFGNGTIASGDFASTSGQNNTASGNVSVAIGEETVASGDRAVSMGQGTTASGFESVAMGKGTMAQGEESVSMGNQTTASGLASVAMGNGSESSGFTAVSMGLSTEASGDKSVSMGDGTLASGESSVAMGIETEASGIGSISMGQESVASANGAVAMGTNTTASGLVSFAMGFQSEALDDGSVAMGSSTIASGPTAFAMGVSSVASGQNSVAFGNQSEASGGNSFAMGLNTITDGLSSAAIGDFCFSDGDYSFSTGKNSKALSYAGTAVGMFNAGIGNPDSPVLTDPIFEIGIGENDANRANAMTVLKNGKVGIGELNPGVDLVVGKNIIGSGGVPAVSIGGINGNGGELVMGSNSSYVYHFANDAITGFSVQNSTGPANYNVLANSLIVGPQNPNFDYIMELQQSSIYGLNMINQDFSWEQTVSPTNGTLRLYNNSQTGAIGEFINASGAYFALSDRSSKEQLLPLSNILQKVNLLDPLRYKFKAEKTDKKSLGFIAQDVKEIFPELVTFVEGRNGAEGTHLMDYSGFGVIAIAAIQEQQKQIEEQEEEIISLKTSLESLLNRVECLENK